MWEQQQGAILGRLGRVAALGQLSMLKIAVQWHRSVPQHTTDGCPNRQTRQGRLPGAAIGTWRWQHQSRWSQRCTPCTMVPT
jgi:hypothetical protein